MDIKRDILLSVLCIALLFISTTLFAVGVQQYKIIQEQNRIIALQTEKDFNQQNIISALEQQLEEERQVTDTLYELAVLHGILQEE